MTSTADLDPRIDYEAWQQAELDAGHSMDDIRAHWRLLNSSVTLSNGEVREVNYHAGATILLVQAVCEEIGARYIIESYNWPTPGVNVCIRTEATSFQRVTSVDGLSHLQDAEAAALAALKAHRASLFGSAAMESPVARRARP